MGSSYVLVIDSPDTVAKTQLQLQHPVKETGLPLLVGPGIDAALEELKRQDSAGARPILVLLGPNLERPVAVARRLHREVPLAHLGFLTNGTNSTLEQQLKSPLAMVGTRWRVIDLTSENPPTLLQDAANSARRQLQFRTTLSHINGQLASHMRADLARRRQNTISDRFLANILEHAHDAIIATNNDGLIITWNNAAEVMFGLSQDDMVGLSIDDIADGHLPEKLRHLISQFRFLETAYSRQELECRRSDEGQPLYVELMLSVVRHESGPPIGISAVARDITERIRLEEAQRKLNEKLIASNEALEQSNIDLQQFAYIASHDLQAPLRTIAGFAQFLQEDYRGKLDDNADDFIERIVAGVERMRTLISDLLAYSRVESRSRPFEPICLNAVFDDAVALLGTSITDAGGEVTRDALPTVAGDRSQLSQLLQNLIGNGIKYHADQPPRVHVSAEKNGREWIVSVHDNGIGIAPKHHKRIFEIFRRLHTQKKYPGTGIGLAVCRRIVQRHGGKIWVESEPGAGTVFYFTIPEASQGVI